MKTKHEAFVKLLKNVILALQSPYSFIDFRGEIALNSCLYRDPPPFLSLVERLEVFHSSQKTVESFSNAWEYQEHLEKQKVLALKILKSQLPQEMVQSSGWVKLKTCMFCNDYGPYFYKCIASNDEQFERPHYLMDVRMRLHSFNGRNGILFLHKFTKAMASAEEVTHFLKTSNIRNLRIKEIYCTAATLIQIADSELDD
jgi:hypothetical protein